VRHVKAMVGKPLFVTVLKTGGEYNASHVNALYRQVGEDFLCLTNDPTGLECWSLPLHEPKLKGWWAKMNLFAPSAPSDFFYMDLDTVVLGDISDIATYEKNLCIDDVWRGGCGSGLLRVVDKGTVWRNFINKPEFWCKWAGEYGDQKVIGELWQYDFLQSVFPNRIKSYKAHKLQSNERPEADIVYFHGKPRPWHVKHPWLPCYDV